jgi:hypothetical protein
MSLGFNLAREQELDPSVDQFSSVVSPSLVFLNHWLIVTSNVSPGSPTSGIRVLIQLGVGAEVGP